MRAVPARGLHCDLHFLYESRDLKNPMGPIVNQAIEGQGIMTSIRVKPPFESAVAPRLMIQRPETIPCC